MDIKEYVYRTELHAHTAPASGCGKVAAREVVEIYSKCGYHSIVIANHFFSGMSFIEDKEECIRTYLRDYETAVEAGRTFGINVILGCELRLNENINDYLLFGINKDFLDWAYERLEMGIAEFSKVYRDDSHLIIQAHPFRNGMTQVSPEYLDGIEIFNMHTGHNSRNALAVKFAKEHNLIKTAGTDFHYVGNEGLTALLTENEMKDSHDIEKVLRNGNYLLEVGGPGGGVFF